MVRRLKEDIRNIEGGLPKRIVKQVDIVDLPDDAPELVLSRLLDEYRKVRRRRMTKATKRKQAEAALLISGLQQRLLSSIEAFAKTLAVHRRTMERAWAPQGEPRQGQAGNLGAFEQTLLGEGLEADDDRSLLPEAEQQALVERAVEQATLATLGDAAPANVARERALLTEMENVAEQARSLPDARVRELIKWIREHMCSGVRMPGEARTQPDAPWSDMRLLIFTEYDDTKRYLVEMLRSAIWGTHLDEYRLEVFHGPTPPDKREVIKRAFNQPPQTHPLRILIATDAGREGLNLQAHCHNLFHFDVPWNPSRLEQRNGRIDRKLQPQPEVYCHYFVYQQRPEDQILRALVRKTETIRKELGSLAQVLDERLSEVLKNGIGREDIDRIVTTIKEADLDQHKKAAAEEELEAVRERQKDELLKQIRGLRNRIHEASKWMGLDMDHLHDALSCSLELLDAEPLKAISGPKDQPARFVFPDLESRRGADASWFATLDALRLPPEDGKRSFQWRKDSPVRPVIFEAPEGIEDDVVQLHLDHRIVKRLLARFTSQGFTHFDLSRACLAQSGDTIPRVVLLGRLSLYGKNAVRLHEEILSVTARWTEPSLRRGPLTPYGRDAEGKTLELLEQALSPLSSAGSIPDPVSQKLLASLSQDLEQLLPHLEGRGEETRREIEGRLAERGKIESKEMRRILEDQKDRVVKELQNTDGLFQAGFQLKMLPTDEARRQYEAEKKQFEANRRAWQRWIARFEEDIAKEPGRIRDFYHTASYRIEPVGVAYLWPTAG